MLLVSLIDLQCPWVLRVMTVISAVLSRYSLQYTSITSTSNCQTWIGGFDCGHWDAQLPAWAWHQAPVSGLVLASNLIIDFQWFSSITIHHLFQSTQSRAIESLLFILVEWILNYCKHPLSNTFMPAQEFDSVVMCSWFGVVLVEKLWTFWTFLLYVSLLARKETWARKHSVIMYDGHRCSSFLSRSTQPHCATASL